MRIGILSPVAWRTPPRHYGPWEQVASNICEGLVAKGFDVTLFATGDSITRGKLEYVCSHGYEEDRTVEPKVWECLHISHFFEMAKQFDIIHNSFDFLPLTYTRLINTPMVTTIHGFSSPSIIPVYKRYNKNNHYVSISNSDRNLELDYVATVYNGIDLNDFKFRKTIGDYLLFFGRIHHDKGAKEAIEIAKKFNMKLIMAGIIQDKGYFEKEITPHIDNDKIVYSGTADPGKRTKLLGEAYALLHPINFEEPFGLSVVESMACGTPVVAFNKGSMPELIKDSETGFLTENINGAVDSLKRIPDINREICRKWVENNFSKKKMVDDYIKVYKKILLANC